MLIDSARNNIKYVIDILYYTCALCSFPAFNSLRCAHIYEFLRGITYIFFFLSIAKHNQDALASKILRVTSLSFPATDPKQFLG